MKSISLKKLRFFSLSLLTLCCLGIVNETQAAESAVEASTFRSKSSSSLSGFQRTEAIVESTNVINTFVLKLAAAIRASTGSAEQKELVRQVQETLTKKFSITFLIGDVIIASANDFDSLLTLVQSQSSSTTFDSSLVGNLSLENIFKTRRERRTLQFQGSQYIVQTPLSGPSYLLTTLDQWTVVETRRGGFKIKTFFSPAISKIPFGTSQ